MEGTTVWVSMREDTIHLDNLLKDGWVPDPVLMPTGRPNVIEGLGAIYHLTRFLDAVERETYIHRFDAPPQPKIGEFDDVVETRDVPHGPVPEGFTVWNLYQKNMIVVKRKTEVRPS